MITHLVKLRCVPRVPCNTLSTALVTSKQHFSLKAQDQYSKKFINQTSIRSRTNTQITFTQCFCSTEFQLPPTATYEEVLEALNDSTAIVIDVRQPGELEKDGAIPGALNIPLGDLEMALSFRPKKFERIFKTPIDNSTPIVFSCLAGIRSRKAQEVARMLGYTNTSNFTGGWVEWSDKSRS